MTEHSCDHIKTRGKGENTRLLVTIPLSLRRQMATFSAAVGISQQAIVRAGIAHLIETHRVQTLKDAAAQTPTEAPKKPRKPRAKKEAR
jgi:hypothetical protein